MKAAKWIPWKWNQYNLEICVWNNKSSRSDDDNQENEEGETVFWRQLDWSGSGGWRLWKNRYHVLTILILLPSSVSIFCFSYKHVISWGDTDIKVKYLRNSGYSTVQASEGHSQHWIPISSFDSYPDKLRDNILIFLIKRL